MVPLSVLKPAVIYVRSVNNTQVWKKIFVATAFADHSTAFNLKAEKPFLKVSATIYKNVKAPHAGRLLSALLLVTKTLTRLWFLNAATSEAGKPGLPSTKMAAAVLARSDVSPSCPNKDWQPIIS